MAANTQRIGVMADVHGLDLIIWQDHDGVRIDAGRVEIMLTIPMLRQFFELGIDAGIIAGMWREAHSDG